MFYFYEEKGNSIRADYSRMLEYGAHIHGHLELVYMLEGETQAMVDFEEYTIAKGDVFFVFPNQVHLYHQDQVKRCMLLIFPPHLCPEFLRVFEQYKPVSPVLPGADGVPGIREMFEQIIDIEYNAPPYAEHLRRGSFLILLGRLFACMQLEEQTASDTSTMKRLLNYCANHYTADISLETTARELHMSKYYLSHLFRQKLHTGFREYINMLRVSEAQRLLREKDMQVTEIAFAVGFNSTRSFNRVFLQSTGLTPGKFRKL